MKKIKYTSEDYIKAVINKMLEKHSVSYDFVKSLKEGLINGELWCSYYTFTEEEFQDWKQWCWEFTRDKCKPKINKKRFEKDFSWLNLMWGLRIKK